MSYLVALLAFFVLVASLHKEILLSGGKQPIVRAIRLHHLAQLIVVLVTLGIAVRNDLETKQFRVAQLDAAAASAAAKHGVPIFDVLYLKLSPAASALKNIGAFETALAGTHLALRQDSILERASPALARQRQEALASFGELQRIAREVLAEASFHGDRYPPLLVTWAERTLELKPSDLPTLLGNTKTAFEYGELTGKAIGYARTAARDAQVRLEK
jgi:hypothetical protein